MLLKTLKPKPQKRLKHPKTKPYFGPTLLGPSLGFRVRRLGLLQRRSLNPKDPNPWTLSVLPRDPQTPSRHAQAPGELQTDLILV